MPSYQITTTPSRRAAARYVSQVRRQLQKALVEEAAKNGLTQSEIARRLDVHRSVINREFNGRKDITLGRVGELAWAMGRKAEFGLAETVPSAGANIAPPSPIPLGRAATGVNPPQETSDAGAHGIKVRARILEMT